MGGDKPKNGDFRHFLAENRHFGAQFFLAPSIMGGAKKYFPPSWGGGIFLLFAFQKILRHIFFAVCISQHRGGDFFRGPLPTMGGNHTYDLTCDR